MSRGKLLWIGDACCQSGFAKATHETLKTLVRYWDVTVLGLNYRGDPNPYRDLYDVYPAMMRGDGFGLKFIKELRRKIIPDVVVVQNDPWNFPAYMKPLEGLPVIGAVAVDGLNCRGTDLAGLRLAVFWTDFGDREARAGGYSGKSAVVPLGVDLSTFKPVPQHEARQRIGIPAQLNDAFIIGNVNRNQPRKRFDLTIRYFSKWIKRYNVPDAYLLLHIAPTGDAGYDCVQLAHYYDIPNRVITCHTDVFNGVSDQHLNNTYNSFDLQFTTTQGEGWGLPAIEGMAAGVPLLAPDWAALGEWAKPAAHLVPCTSTSATINEINVIGGVMDEERAIESLQLLYTDDEYRRSLSMSSVKLAHQPQFRWENIGEAFNAAIERALDYTPMKLGEDGERRTAEVR